MLFLPCLKPEKGILDVECVNKLLKGLIVSYFALVSCTVGSLAKEAVTQH